MRLNTVQVVEPFPQELASRGEGEREIKRMRRAGWCRSRERGNGKPTKLSRRPTRAGSGKAEMQHYLFREDTVSPGK